MGYCFDSEPELGGQGYLIGLHKKKVREQTVNRDTGKRTSKGNAFKFNGVDLVLTDCNLQCNWVQLRYIHEAQISSHGIVDLSVTAGIGRFSQTRWSL